MERDNSVLTDLTGFVNFNSHAHVERDEITTADIVDRYDFNSHAHVERDAVCQDWYDVVGISTHTLTWSVTKGRLRAGKGQAISTHTLTWSVTQSA